MEIALAFIEAHFDEPLSLDDVSSACGMSRFHFARIFKAHTGSPFKTFLNQRRIRRAKELLEHREMSITETCFEAGFNDLSYFDRTFQRLEGMTPSAYRALHRGGGAGE